MESSGDTALRPILIAYAGRAVIEAAARLFPAARALVLNVGEPLRVPTFAPGVPVTPEPAPLPPDEELEAASFRLAQEGSEIAAAAGLDAEPLSVKATAGISAAILQVARERDAEAMVVAAHGRSRFVSLLLGSTSDAVAHEAQRPVVIVPMPEEDEA